MKSILFVNKEQFGYHIDTYKYIQYLNDDYNCTYICWDEGKEKIFLKNVNCIYLVKGNFKLFRFFHLISSINSEIRNGNYSLIFLVYFFGCSFLRILNLGKRINLDIRTIAVSNNIYLNFLYDFLLKVECALFKFRSVVSKETGSNLMRINFHVIPLGGECFSQKDKFENKMNLIYVGTLNNRNILDFLEGFHNFYLEIREIDKIMPINLIIIGSGDGNEFSKLKDYIAFNRLEDVVTAPGYIQNSQLNFYFEIANVGVSYIPLTSYYQNQPPTKTYEYLLSGFPVIATATKANAQIIDKDNGFLIQDNSEAVKIALHKMYTNLSTYNPLFIKENSKSYLWKNIVDTNVKPYFDFIIK